ncbi:bifunctional purine biosynthesis protein, putative [Perkinsus marinus ATCC 50983]|uniref:Bifunctional purine biosynthesis protein, putative n=1 Tax=Perkinsus marinus (strain ATCC 50983 / TXsc) TaxID=423536 RepID=C5LB27_PERM5|nr:bifunctional purine biosynthesis protein, putative [Perkinsus marinus ATCC 50983]EER05955.1 bifunctional purine biosynthesis protein, putative [Perkinsus marinus ATCC 50983]|eukprot:XP_002774139.1 bifunctional purine biosynthesis protein, putative [Perkinsus marinus ATCC 50983]
MASLGDSTETLGESVTQTFDVVLSLKYECNPHHQPAAMCSVVGDGLEMPFKVVNGVPGYINLLDAINSWLLVREMDKATGLPAAASFKHVGPAGAAVASTELRDNAACIYEVAPSACDNLSPVALAYIRSRNGDPMCSFGDFVAVSMHQDSNHTLVTRGLCVGFCKDGMMVGIGAGQQSRVDCVKLEARKVQNWWHPKALGMISESSVKKQSRISARVRYIEGDMSGLEYTNWKTDNFESADVPEPLTDDEKARFMRTLTGVAVSSDAFFLFRDSIDVCSRYGVTSVMQPGGSVADTEVIEACDQHSMTMAFSNLRLFHH